MHVEIVSKPMFIDTYIPEYQTPGAAGVDILADIPEPLTLGVLDRAVVPTGLFLAIEPGHEAQVRPRSGLAAKKGVTVLNSPGTLDSDYRGQVGVILANLSNERVTINPGERIAQLVFSRVEVANFVEHTSLSSLSLTVRGAGGFGSTGT